MHAGQPVFTVHVQQSLYVQEQIAPAQVKQSLAERQINVHVSAIGSTRLDFEARQLTEVVRASVHYYNTEDEVALLVKAVTELAHQQ